MAHDDDSSDLCPVSMSASLHLIDPPISPCSNSPLKCHCTGKELRFCQWSPQLGRFCIRGGMGRIMTVHVLICARFLCPLNVP